MRNKLSASGRDRVIFMMLCKELPLDPQWHYCHHKQPQSSSYIHWSFPSGIPKIAGKSGMSNGEGNSVHFSFFTRNLIPKKSGCCIKKESNDL